MSGIPDLIEAIRLQTGGPTEAARAIRKKLKYGTVDQQLRALTVLDGLIENAGPRFQRAFADEPLLERLRVCATDSLSDEEVKQKCAILFKSWAISYKSTPGMERVASLHKQLPKRKKPVTQAQSKVLRETEPAPDEDPFSNDDEEEAGNSSKRPAPASSSRRERFGSLSFSSQPPSSSSGSGFSFGSDKKSKKEKDKDKSKKSRRVINLEKEKPQILQCIASASIASTNLMNALKLIDRERGRVSEDSECLQRFEVCKKLRRQILRYIQMIESEQWLGSLINANDGLVEALMAFEVLDKSVEDDSDSDGGEWNQVGEASDEQPPAKPARPGQSQQQPRSGGNDLSGGLGGLNLGPRGRSTDSPGASDYSEEEEEEENADENDPFADRNEVEESHGKAW